MNETFLLTNIAPQVGADFNRHYWAYVEDWCRRLTGSYQDVFIFTIPLYLPKLHPDGKWRVVSECYHFQRGIYYPFDVAYANVMNVPNYLKTHEVIGSPPNVAVPTHFAKVVLTTRPSSPSTPDVPEISTGAFVLPNAAISDETPFESFVVPSE